MDKTLARAAKRLRRRDYPAALGLIDEVLARDSQYPAALSLRAEVQRAVEEAAKHPVKGFSLWPDAFLRDGLAPDQGDLLEHVQDRWRPRVGGRCGGRRVEGPRRASTRVESSSAPAAAPATTGNPSPTGSPVSVTPPTKEDVDVSPMVVDARRHLGTGDLVAAARAIVPALTAAPENPDVLKTREEILGAAENVANAAKTNADSSGAQSQREYSDATKHLQSAATARRSGRSEDVEPAVREYASAAELYRKALPATFDAAPVVNNATALIKQRSYPQAARVIVEALKRAPGNTDLLGTLQQALVAARDSADGAKRVAASVGRLQPARVRRRQRAGQVCGQRWCLGSSRRQSVSCRTLRNCRAKVHRRL